MATTTAPPPGVPAAPELTRRQRLEYANLRIVPPGRSCEVYGLAWERPELLPRWHQDDRGVDGRGLRHVAPPGAYGAIPCWRTRADWIECVRVAAQLHADVLRRHQVAADTLIRWAIAKSAYALLRNGRRCIVRPLILASVLGLTAGHVKKLNRVARELGVEVVVFAGRMFNLAERDAARATGSRQRGLAAEVALTEPEDVREARAARRRLQGHLASLRGAQTETKARRRTDDADVATPLCSVDSDTPPRGGLVNHSSAIKLPQLHGLTAANEEAAPPPRSQKDDRGRAGLLAIARQVCTMVAWLTDTPAGRIAPALQPFVNGPQPWTARDLAAAVHGKMWRRGHGVHDGATIRQPAPYLAALLRTMDPVADHPDTGPLVPRSPCTEPDCDGSGWITRPRADGTPVATQRCPGCGHQPNVYIVDAVERDDSEPTF